MSHAKFWYCKVLDGKYTPAQLSEYFGFFNSYDADIDIYETIFSDGSMIMCDADFNHCDYRSSYKKRESKAKSELDF